MTMYSTFSGLLDQMDAAQQNVSAMGQAFDAARNDDSFYLPPEVFDNPDFKRGLTMFLSPDGKAARFIITHDGDPATPQGISHVSAIKKAARHAVKGTPLEDAKIFLGGTAATYKDMSDAAKYDLLIAGIAAACLILAIMLIITRSVIAALVIIGTVLLSLGSSFGLSVLVWQDMLGIPLHWLVIAMALIVLLAVGSDYNLLLVSRFKEEIGTGIKTGIIRAMGGTGAVVTSAGLVFAFTMSSFVFSDLRMIGQFGTTVGIGLLFDTLVVRSLMTPSIAALLGRWFWWPQQVGGGGGAGGGRGGRGASPGGGRREPDIVFRVVPFSVPLSASLRTEATDQWASAETLSASAAISGETTLMATPVPSSNPAVVVALGQMWACQW
jgi:RND superfamily putative drug exporter